MLDFAHLSSTFFPQSRSWLGVSSFVLDFLHLDLLLALRSSTRFDSSAPVLDLACIGSTPALRSSTRLGASIAVAAKVEFGNPNKDTYIHYGSGKNQVELYVKAARAFSAFELSGKGAGILHGYWYSDFIVHTSDRRLKKNIRPLVEELELARDRSVAAASTRGRSAAAARADDGATWLLRELRPVSYQFKRPVESKSAQRFGFIADEVEAAIPQVVHALPGETSTHKGILYQDLIAILTAALQSLQHRVEADRARWMEAEVNFARQLQAQEAMFTKQMKAMEARLRETEGRLNASLSERLQKMEGQLEKLLDMSYPAEEVETSMV
eukprot:TRINITY_DN2492_c0_g4_i5.p1 TRINITY_DN2492_c0_g4~~TRINITY_DN2492_c0_g4_i5.p1  ORF type:complete len:326 (+),score=72.06 TRINITY_DN2492_c0_g4_i5:106-1083(+)